ncbi:hypothetical protein DJ010_12215 [Nocardioides silvaticus]|uniref:Collagen-like protein n=1 Tax=Nocardioides silvaticus TaxID=2201891 RepID=A0A316TFD0_9ACTN|nr:hypothetical protein [Nocardioides silvaticus]PWN02498.1 hypothetical protein DJ010_12215 [Nocardioides silvaticus]
MSILTATNAERVRVVLVATLLLLALTAGSATAGALITGKRIKDDTVAGVDVRDQNLTGRDVRDGSLDPTDVGALEPGPQGDRGLPGFPGANGLPGLVQRNAPRTVQPKEQLRWTVQCGPGEASISGGVSSDRPDSVTTALSFVDGIHWTVEVRNDANVPVSVYGWVLCVPA